MLRAYLENKLGRALAKAGVKERALRHALGKSEDALTSSVLARVAYLEPELQWSLLTAAMPRPLSGESWPGCPAGTPEWSFWPSFEPAPNFGEERVEPDVVVKWGSYVLILEVKHHGNQYDWQWKKEIEALRHDRDYTFSKLLFVAVGGNRTEDARRVAAAARPGREDVDFFQIDWPDLHLAARRLMSGGQTAAVQAVLGDMMEALEEAGHYGESGWTPLLGQVGPQANTKAIFKWNPLI